MTIIPQCLGCKHIHAVPGMKCDAYPEGIPEAILLAKHDHRQPFEGDHGIRFEPKSGAEASAR